MRERVSVCVLPDDADIVRGFVKVGGGSGLLSMIVPEAQRSVTSYFTRAINLPLCPYNGWRPVLSAQRDIKSFQWRTDSCQKASSFDKNLH